jgi:hypothetical protein
MARTTRRDVEKAVELLAQYLDMDALAKRYGPGKLAIDHYNPGDNPYAYKIVWISDSHGGHFEPFGSRRAKGSELIDQIHFMRNAICGGVLAIQNR